MYNVKVCSGLGSRVCCTSCTLYVHKMTMSCLIYLIFVCDHLFGSCLECLEKNCEGKHYQTFLPAGALLRQGPAMAGAPCPGSSALSPSSWGKLENCNPGSHHPASLTWVIYSWCKHVKNRSVAELLFFNPAKRGDWRSYQDWWPKHRKHLASSYFSMHGQSALLVGLMDPGPFIRAFPDGPLSGSMAWFLPAHHLQFSRCRSW